MRRGYKHRFHKTMLHRAIFFLQPCNLCRNKRCVATCKNDFSCNTPFLQPAMQQNAVLRVSGKVELSSTFRNVARKVATCDMSIKNCNAILLKEPIRARLSVARGRFQAGGRSKSCKKFPAGAFQVTKKYYARVTPPLQLAMFFSCHRCVASCKKNSSCNMTYKPS